MAKGNKIAKYKPKVEKVKPLIFPQKRNQSFIKGFVKRIGKKTKTNFSDKPNLRYANTPPASRYGGF